MLRFGRSNSDILWFPEIALYFAKPKFLADIKLGLFRQKRDIIVPPVKSLLLNSSEISLPSVFMSLILDDFTKVLRDTHA